MGYGSSSSRLSVASTQTSKLSTASSGTSRLFPRFVGVLLGVRSRIVASTVFHRSREVAASAVSRATAGIAAFRQSVRFGGASSATRAATSVIREKSTSDAVKVLGVESLKLERQATAKVGAAVTPAPSMSAQNYSYLQDHTSDTLTDNTGDPLFAVI